MSDVRMVKLGDLCEINPRAPKLTDETLTSFVSMSDLSSSKARTISETSRPYHEVKKGYTGFQDQDILIAKITPCWENIKIGIANIKNNFGFGSTEFHVIRASDEVTRRYLLHFLRNPHVNLQGQLRMTGSGGQKRVPAKFFEDLQVPLPSLEEQKRIVAILDKAQSIQEARERQLAALDELASSLFQSVNRLSNTKVTLGEVISFSSHSIIPGAEHQNMPNIGPDCIEPNTGFLKGWRTIQEDSAISAKYLFTEGDILYSKIRPYLNKVSIADFTGLCSSEIYPLTAKKEIANTYYIAYLLRSSIFLQYSELNSTGANIPRINKSNIEKFEFKLPDLNIQNIFAEKIKKILHTRSFVQSSLEEYKILLRSLQSSLFIH